jgi:hypothetical protein
MSVTISQHRYCIDDNPKIVRRTYNWDGKEIKIDLCEDHQKDPDFSSFISEVPL